MRALGFNWDWPKGRRGMDGGIMGLPMFGPVKTPADLSRARASSPPPCSPKHVNPAGPCRAKSQHSLHYCHALERHGHHLHCPPNLHVVALPSTLSLSQLPSGKFVKFPIFHQPISLSQSTKKKSLCNIIPTHIILPTILKELHHNLLFPSGNSKS